MDYSGYGFIGFALLFGMLFCIFSSRNIEHYKLTLDSQQLDIYKSIINFRLNLWLQGLLLGVIAAIGVCYFMEKNFNTYGNAVLFTAVLMVVNYMYYMLFPKPAWMLEFTKNQKQVKEWLDVYKSMRNRYHIGMLFGIVAYFFLSLSFFDYNVNKNFL